MSAVAFTSRVLYCDHACTHRPCEGCSRQFQGSPGDKNAEVRRAAKRSGWAYRSGHPASDHPKGRDFCPEHASDAAPRSNGDSRNE